MKAKKAILLFAVISALILAAGCQKGSGAKDKARTDDLSKQLEAQRAEAERLARLAAEEARLCVAQSATEFQQCTDGIDNDCDKLTDCGDTEDCAADPACATGQEGGEAITRAEIGR